MLPLYVTSQRVSQSIKPVSRPSHPTITHIEYWDLENYLHRAHRAVRSSAWVQPHHFSPCPDPESTFVRKSGPFADFALPNKNTHRICIFWIKRLDSIEPASARAPQWLAVVLKQLREKGTRTNSLFNRIVHVSKLGGKRPDWSSG